MTIGERIAGARKQAGMSQYALAVACGVRQTTIGRIETGKVKSPRTALVAKIASALGTTIESLIGDAEPVSRPRLVARTDDALDRIFEALATISADIVTMKADISDTKARLDAIEASRSSPPVKGHGNGSKRGSRQ